MITLGNNLLTSYPGTLCLGEGVGETSGRHGPHSPLSPSLHTDCAPSTFPAARPAWELHRTQVPAERPPSLACQACPLSYTVPSCLFWALSLRFCLQRCPSVLTDALPRLPEAGDTGPKARWARPG